MSRFPISSNMPDWQKSIRRHKQRKFEGGATLPVSVASMQSAKRPRPKPVSVASVGGLPSNASTSPTAVAPPWEQEIYRQNDIAIEQEEQRSAQREADSVGRLQLSHTFHNPQLMRQEVADEVAGMDFKPRPATSGGRISGLYGAGYARPAWLQQSLDQDADRARKDRNWANSKHINGPVDPIPVEYSPGETDYLTEVDPAAPGAAKTLDGLLARRRRAFINHPAVQANLAASRKYLDLRNSGQNAAAPPVMQNRMPAIDPNAKVKFDDQDMAYSDYRKAMDKRHKVNVAKRKKDKSSKPSLAERRAMVRQKARGEHIDPLTARAMVLNRLEEGQSNWLAAELDRRRLDDMSPEHAALTMRSRTAAAENDRLREKDKATSEYNNNMLGLTEAYHGRLGRDAETANAASKVAVLSDSITKMPEGSLEQATALKQLQKAQEDFLGTTAPPTASDALLGEGLLSSSPVLSADEQTEIDHLVKNKKATELANLFHRLEMAGRDIPMGQKNALLQQASKNWSANMKSPEGEWFRGVNSLFRKIGLQDDWSRHQPSPFRYDGT